MKEQTSDDVTLSLAFWLVSTDELDGIDLLRRKKLSSYSQSPDAQSSIPSRCQNFMVSAALRPPGPQPPLQAEDLGCEQFNSPSINYLKMEYCLADTPSPSGSNSIFFLRVLQNYILYTARLRLMGVGVGVGWGLGSTWF